MLVLLGIEFHFWGFGFIWFVIPDIALTALIIFGVYWLIDKFSRGGASILLPSGKSTPFEPQYSEQDALIVRGNFAEAADSYRAIIADDPRDVVARLRLGRVLEEHCGDYEGAEASYRSIRTLAPDDTQQWLASNALVDLFQRTGQRDKLKAEYGRMSRQYAGTTAGANARRRYEELATPSAE
jgi:tetratricopeptide (TPR) repeat protein